MRAYPNRFRSDQSRQRLVQLIHIAKSQLGMDDSTYRAMLAGLELPDSTTKMNVPELTRVLEHLKRSGFEVRSKVNSTAKQRPQAGDDQSRMMRGLWLELHALGYVQNTDESALAAWVKRETGVDALQWLNGKQAQATIEKLKQWRWRDVRKIDAIAQRLHAEGKLPVNSAVDLAKLWFGADDISKTVAQQLLARLKVSH
jgi:phage gp16-like protein